MAWTNTWPMRFLIGLTRTMIREIMGPRPNFMRESIITVAKPSVFVMALLICVAVSLTLAQPLPAIIPIPGSRGNTGLGMQKLRANVEKAIGADILFEKEG